MEEVMVQGMILFEEFQDFFKWTLVLVLVPVSLLACFHVCVTGPHVQHLLQTLWTEWRRIYGPPAKMSQRQQDQKLRFEEELLRTRVRMLTMFNKLMIHFSFAVTLATFWKFINTPSVASFLQFLGPILGYTLDVAFHQGVVKIQSHEQFLKLEAVGLTIHAIFALSIGMETDFHTFCAVEKISGAIFFFMSVTIIDPKITLPLYIFEATVHIARQWQLIGFGNLTPQIVYATLAAHLIFFWTLAFCDQLIRSNISAKLDSGDAASLVRGFRQVLRGVCEGDLVLDGRGWSIVDDASCLERLLKSKKTLTDTNFLDLFLDTESRESFLRFLGEVEPQDGDDGSPSSSTSNSQPAVPRGLRVSLQGATGPVSLDLFCTRLPGYGPSGTDQCLLALKEDPEQCLNQQLGQAVPEADPRGTVRSGALPLCAATHRVRSRSSVSEVVEAYDELIEVALLVSNATGLLDIEEAHLSFQRQSNAPLIEQGMPTLRRFIRPSDWDRVEGMFNFVTDLPPTEERQRCYFRRPMLFRLPGESRSYLCSRQTSVSRADRYVVPGTPVHYWMHFSAFDSSQVQRPREQELSGIEEES